MENPLIARAIATIKQAIAADASLDGDKAFELYSRSCLLLTNAVKDETNTVSFCAYTQQHDFGIRESYSEYPL